jgi:hypothetical protein
MKSLLAFAGRHGPAILRSPRANIHLLRIFHAAVLVGLGVTVSACQQSRQPPESEIAAAQGDEDNLASRRAQATKASVVGKRLDTYIGEIYSSEQNALASQPADAEAPSF